MGQQQSVNIEIEQKAEGVTLAKAEARQIVRIFWMSRRVDTSKALTYESGSILTGKPAKPASVANSNKNKQTQTQT